MKAALAWYLNSEKNKMKDIGMYLFRCRFIFIFMYWRCNDIFTAVWGVYWWQRSQAQAMQKTDLQRRGLINKTPVNSTVLNE